MVIKAEIPEGYKQTEVGVIPEDWEIDKIRNLTSITTGAKNTQDKVDNGDYPFFVRSSIVERINSYSFDGEAVLTAGDGVGTGKIYHYINGKFDFHQRVYKISDFSEKLNGYYFHLFFSNNFYNRIMSMTAKSSVDSVRREMIANMLISFPPTKAEQEAIAEAVSDADALIESLEKLIAKKRNIKQGMMQQLLTGKKRLPGFNGKWETKILKEIAQIPVTDGPHLTPKFLQDGIPFLSVNNLVNNRIDLADLRYISKEDHVLFSKKCKPEKDDLLLGKAASVGRVAIVDLDIEFNIWSPIALIRINDQNVPKFIYYCIQSQPITRQIELFTNSSSQGNIGMGDIEKLEFLLPSNEEQRAIAQILSDMDAEIEGLEQKRDKYKAIKQGMMQELLSGKTRLI